MRIKNAFNGIFYRKRRRFVNLQTSVQAMFVNITNQVTEALLSKQSKKQIIRNTFLSDFGDGA